MAAAQSLSALLGTPTTDKATGSSAVGLIQQSQKGFASLQPEAKADGAAVTGQKTGGANNGGAQASAVTSGSNDPVIKANVDRVVAMYLDGSSTARAA